jgi:hypothetical protein
MASPFLRHPPVDQPIETEFCANWHRLQGRASSGFGASPMSLSARVVFIVLWLSAFLKKRLISKLFGVWSVVSETYSQHPTNHFAGTTTGSV